MEAGLVEPDGGSPLHELVGVVEHAVGGERYVALGRHHDFDLHATVYGSLDGAVDRGYECEVGVDDAHGVLGVVEGVDVELAHDLIGGVGLAVGNAHELAACGGCGVGLQTAEAVGLVGTEVLRSPDVLAGGLLPDAGKDELQLVDGTTLDAAMHVAPLAHLLGAVDIVVGHVHAAGVGYLSVDDHDLAVVAWPDVVDPREADGVELPDVDAVFAQRADVVLQQGLVVGVVAEAVEHCPDLDALASFLTQEVEEHGGDAVVAEVEVFKVDAMAGLAYGLEHVVELLLSGHEERHAVVVGEANAALFHLPAEQGVGGLGTPGTRGKTEEDCCDAGWKVEGGGSKVENGEH